MKKAWDTVSDFVEESVDKVVEGVKNVAKAGQSIVKGDSKGLMDSLVDIVPVPEDAKKILSKVVNYEDTILENVSGGTTQAFKSFEVAILEHTVRVKVTNKTGRNIYAVNLIHKYSNVYKDNQRWEVIASNESSSYMKARYRTNTPGSDWWFLTWVDEDRNIYFTLPDDIEMRKVLDLIEKIPKQLTGTLRILRKASPSLTAKSIAAGVEIVNSLANTFLLNDEQTAGFHQLMLRADDAETSKWGGRESQSGNKPLEIILNKDKVFFQVTFNTTRVLAKTKASVKVSSDIEKLLPGIL